MTITFFGVGTVAKAFFSNITPTLPVGWLPDDIFICIMASTDNANATMPAGWTAIDAGTDNGIFLRSTCYYRRAILGDTDPLITYGGLSIVAQIAAYRGCITSGSPIDVQGVTLVNGSSDTITANAIVTLTNNAMVLFFGAIGSVGGMVTISSYSGSPTPTLRIDNPNTGGYNEISLADFILSPAGTTGSRTATFTGLLWINNGLLFALKPQPGIVVPFNALLISGD